MWDSCFKADLPTKLHPLLPAHHSGTHHLARLRWAWSLTLLLKKLLFCLLFSSASLLFKTFSTHLHMWFQFSSESVIISRKFLVVIIFLILSSAAIFCVFHFPHLKKVCSAVSSSFLQYIQIGSSILFYSKQVFLEAAMAT